MLVTSLTKTQCDIRDESRVKEVVNSDKFDFVINASAYTNVDEAESNIDSCELVNAQALKNVCSSLKGKKTLLIHFSTDYVFDGVLNIPYKESDIPNPINQYGKSKLNGERIVENSDINHIIFRTSWVYDDCSRNFPNKIIHNIINNKVSHVVDDQVGTPNHVNFIAEATYRCITEYSNYNYQNKLNACGIYHMSTFGETSWYKFSCYLSSEYKRKKNIKNTPSIFPISSQDLSLNAARPRYSVLNAQKLSQQFELELPSWQHYADKYINSKI